MSGVNKSYFMVEMISSIRFGCIGAFGKILFLIFAINMTGDRIAGVEFQFTWNAVIDAHPSLGFEIFAAGGKVKSMAK